MSKLDVLIVGAGPSGLMMATELAAWGISFRIIDKAPAPTDKSKALAIQPRTLEIFDHIGIVDRFLEKGLRLKAANPISQKKRIARIPFESLDSPFNFILSLEQSKTEQLLIDHLRSLGVNIEREKELVRFEQTHEEVKATIRDNKTGKEETLQASWMIACDGAHSTIRKELELSFIGKTFSDVFSLADVHIDWDFPHDELFVYLEGKGVLAAVPLPEKNRYRLIFQLPRCREALKRVSGKDQILDSKEIPDPTVEETQEILTKYHGTGAKIRDPEWMANFHINSRLTSKYRQGRIFLVGDAAHIHSPVGGQGMNTGIQDAFNLGWKLAFEIRSKAKSDLLNTYEIERQSVGKALLKTTERATFIATLHNPAAIFLRNKIIVFLLGQKKIQQKLIRAISQIGIHYPKSSIVSNNCGMRAPNAPITVNGKQTDLYSLWRGKRGYKLLLFEMTPEIPERFEIHADHILYITTIQREIVGATTVIDTCGEVCAAYGIKKKGLCLIRPDLYIETIKKFD